MASRGATSAQFRVRFAHSKQQYRFNAAISTHESVFHPEQALTDLKRPYTKSRTGCQECRSRRVKCDETYPICRRCEQRGTLCRPTPRMVKWQIEMPWHSFGPYQSPLYGIANVNHRLLQIWMERICQIMVIDPDNSPWSFPIIAHLQKCPSLVHALQSTSAGYEGHFQGKDLILCLEERHHALVSLREELKDSSGSMALAFLTIFVLGFTTSWISGDVCAFGQEHLTAAHRLVDSIVAKAGETAEPDPLVHFIVGYYVYWDMCCAMLADPGIPQPLNQPQMSRYIQSMRGTYHAITGYSMELFYLLANLERYCRKVLDYGEHDVFLEVAFEEQLTTYAPPSDNSDRHFGIATECLRNHGLMLLYRICGCSGLLTTAQPWMHDIDADDNERDNVTLRETSGVGTEELIRNLALDTAEKLSEIPISSPTLNMLAFPILTAGSELDSDQVEERKECRTRMASLYSRNRCPPNLWACQLLDELWQERDSTGSTISWPALALRKGWQFSMA